jgi:hypothetical protein
MDADTEKPVKGSVDKISLPDRKFFYALPVMPSVP